MIQQDLSGSDRLVNFCGHKIPWSLCTWANCF